MPRVKSKGPIINGVHEQINSSIFRLALRQYKHIKLPLTFEDLRRLFIAPEWRDRLSEAFEYAAPGGVTYELTAGIMDQRVGNGDRLRSITVTFNWRSGNANGFLVPRGMGTSLNAMTAVQSDCPTDLMEKWETILHEMCDVAHEFGKARWVLDKLNHKDVCPSAAAIRYYWPCLLPLLEMTRSNDLLVDEIREPSARAAWYAKVPADVHELLKETNDYMASAMLVDDPGITNLPVDYKMNDVMFGKFKGVLDHT